jgi:hypothetical protein
VIYQLYMPLSRINPKYKEEFFGYARKWAQKFSRKPNFKVDMLGNIHINVQTEPILLYQFIRNL